jgi:hypothetical protein
VVEPSENKRILVIGYSQTGQLHSITDSITSPLKNAGFEVDSLIIEPETAYPFPWKGTQFFDAFPESVEGIPCRLRPIDYNKDVNYDLIIIAYQIWYLNISIPINSFLKSPEALGILKGKDVVTVIGCRNMWVMAHERMKRLLLNMDARLRGNIVLSDKGNNLIGLITVMGWMFSGKKKPFKLLPSSGVTDDDINNSSSFGHLIEEALTHNKMDTLYQDLFKKGAFTLVPKLFLLEKRASRIFKIWSRFIAGNTGQLPGHPSRLRRARVLMFILPIGAFILAPIMAIISAIRLAISRKKLAAELLKYESVKPVE